MHKRMYILAAIAVGLTLTQASAADLVRGKKVMGMCQVCHGKDGIAKLEEAPNLAGQKESYLVKALMDYKTGARQNEQMAVVASGLEDADIADVAAYYASIPFKVGP
ncbi:hypothetical protein ASG43_18380 [Aureimonas sp. Leaf454]|nr:hypothetical protein ASG43_18380 [Aureimonas sp. Leaf454]